MIMFMHFFNAREIMLYLCIHVVYLLGSHYPVALKRLVERRDEEEDRLFGILYLCCLIG